MAKHTRRGKQKGDWVMYQRGYRWLPEDVMNLMEMVAEERDWQHIADVLGRSVAACKHRYGMLRFTRSLSAYIPRIKKRVIMTPIRRYKGSR